MHERKPILAIAVKILDKTKKALSEVNMAGAPMGKTAAEIAESQKPKP